LGVLRPLMNELGMGVQVCPASRAMDTLQKGKFDTVIVDCDEDENGAELLASIRQNQWHQKAVAVGITSNADNMQNLFDNGATFVLSKPLPVEDARRILRISKGIITKVVRRFLRLEVGNMATATLGDNQESIILNISQRGLAIQAAQPLTRGQMIYVSFLLPDTFDLVEGMVEVMWADGIGRAGIEFRTLAEDMQQMMSRWVFSRARAQNLILSEPIPEFEDEFDPAQRIETARPRFPFLPFTSHHHAKAKAVGSILLAVVVDLLVVGLGTVLFFGFGAISGAEHISHPMALAVGIAFWAIYRFLFFFFNVSSPGEKAVQQLVDVR
jgi:CheY-like chemotaxis protein